MSGRHYAIICRTILRFYTLRGWGVKEIAEAVGWGRGAVYLLRRGDTQRISYGRYLDLISFAHATGLTEREGYAADRVRAYGARQNW